MKLVLRRFYHTKAVHAGEHLLEKPIGRDVAGIGKGGARNDIRCLAKQRSPSRIERLAASWVKAMPVNCSLSWNLREVSAVLCVPKRLKNVRGSAQQLGKNAL